MKLKGFLVILACVAGAIVNAPHAFAQTAQMSITYTNDWVIYNGGNFNFDYFPIQDRLNNVTLTIHNNGGTAITLTGSPKVALSGGGSGEFTVDSSSLPASISGGSTATFTVRYSPATNDGTVKTALATIATGSGNYTFTLESTSRQTFTKTFTASGTLTAAETGFDPALLYANITLVGGGGGGGGSGSKKSSGSYGGNGGGGGAGQRLVQNNYQLTASSYTITLGTGGPGGAGGNSGNSGSAGTAGTASTFAVTGGSTIYTAAYGSGGGRGGNDGTSDYGAGGAGNPAGASGGTTYGGNGGNNGGGYGTGSIHDQNGEDGGSAPANSGGGGGGAGGAQYGWTGNPGGTGGSGYATITVYGYPPMIPDAAVSTTAQKLIPVILSAPGQGVTASSWLQNTVIPLIQSYVPDDNSDSYTTIVAYVPAGNYYFDSTISLGSTFNPNKVHIVFKSNPGETVRFIGGVKLINTDFAAVTSADDVYSKLPNPSVVKKVDLTTKGLSSFPTFPCDVHDGSDPCIFIRGRVVEGTTTVLSTEGYPQELFFDGHPSILARWPNKALSDYTGDYVCSTEDYSYYTAYNWSRIITPNLPASKTTWAASENPYVYLFENGNEDHFIKLQAVEAYDGNPTTIKLAWDTEEDVTSGHPYRFIIVNLVEELNNPGEYYIDTMGANQGMMYYYPPRTMTASDDIYLSNVTTLLSIDSCDNVTFDGIIFEGAKENLVHVTNSNNIVFDHCVLRNSGKAGLIIRSTNDFTGDRSIGSDEGVNVLNSVGCGIRNSEIYDTGETAIFMRAGNRAYLKSCGYFIENCSIHDYSRLEQAQYGVILYGVGISVRYNQVSRGPGQGIYYRGNDHLIQYNSLLRLCQGVDDDGAIYSNKDWGDRGVQVLNNLIYKPRSHFDNSDSNNAGIYNDAGSSGLRAYGNIVYQAQSAAGFVDGRNIRYEYNIFAESGGAIFVKRDTFWYANDWNLLDHLEEFNYWEAPWISKYPDLIGFQGLSTDDKTMPQYNHLKNNILYNCTSWDQSSLLGLYSSSYTSYPYIKLSTLGESNYNPFDTTIYAFNYFVDKVFDSGELVSKSDNSTSDPGFVEPGACNFSFSQNSPIHSLISGNSTWAAYWSDIVNGETYFGYIPDEPTIAVTSASGTSGTRTVNFSGIAEGWATLNSAAVLKYDLCGNYLGTTDITSNTTITNGEVTGSATFSYTDSDGFCKVAVTPNHSTPASYVLSDVTGTSQASPLRNITRIKNLTDSTYLWSDNGVMKSTAISSADTRSHWIIYDMGTHYAIQNRSTGLYLTLYKYSDYVLCDSQTNSPLGCQWTFDGANADVIITSCQNEEKSLSRTASGVAGSNRTDSGIALHWQFEPVSETLAADTQTPQVSVFETTTSPTLVGYHYEVGVNLEGTDNTAVRSYMITMTDDEEPLASDSRWQDEAPTVCYVPAAAGTHTLYAWVKDYAGNVCSAPESLNVTISSGTINATFDFTTPGETVFCLQNYFPTIHNVTATITVIGGGGGGGGGASRSSATSTTNRGGGGGGGGAGQTVTQSNYSLTAGTSYLLRVGYGGQSGHGGTYEEDGDSGANGEASYFDTIEALSGFGGQGGGNQSAIDLGSGGLGYDQVSGSYYVGENNSDEGIGGDGGPNQTGGVGGSSGAEGGAAPANTGYGGGGGSGVRYIYTGKDGGMGGSGRVTIVITGTL